LKKKEILKSRLKLKQGGKNLAIKNKIATKFCTLKINNETTVF